jgi:Spy/CpxP family protein refolding chaperone
MMDMDMMMGGMGGKKKGMGGMSGMGGMMDMDMMMGGMGGKKKGMGGMSGMGGMMDMDMMMGGMSGKGGSMPGMGMMKDDMDMMGMMGMGSMSGMGAKGMKMKMASALPGFPGASHIYHIGATNFFLDHPEHITLTTEQQTKLNKAKQKALLDKSKAQRKIDEAEQALWELTGADEPDAAQIQAKVQEIEKLRGEQRLAFIRAVGEAAKALTDEQRQALLGNAKPQTHQHAAPPSK